MIAYAFKRYKDLKVTIPVIRDTYRSHNPNEIPTEKTLKKHLTRLVRLGLAYDLPHLGKPHPTRPNLIEILDHHRVYRVTEKGIAVFQMQRNDAIMFKCLNEYDNLHTEY